MHVLEANKRRLQVRVRLCAGDCSLCIDKPRYSEPLDAWRINPFHVRVTEPESVFFGSVLSKSDYEICDRELGLLPAEV